MDLMNMPEINDKLQFVQNLITSKNYSRLNQFSVGEADDYRTLLFIGVKHSGHLFNVEADVVYDKDSISDDIIEIKRFELSKSTEV